MPWRAANFESGKPPKAPHTHHSTSPRGPCRDAPFPCTATLVSHALCSIFKGAHPCSLITGSVGPPTPFKSRPTSGAMLLAPAPYFALTAPASMRSAGPLVASLGEAGIGNVAVQRFALSQQLGIDASACFLPRLRCSHAQPGTPWSSSAAGLLSCCIRRPVRMPTAACHSARLASNSGTTRSPAGPVLHALCRVAQLLARCCLTTMPAR